ncbi:hypothetical protein [Actinopolymorpha alba]|uniref:hypothetical protein n=1 Tax=Actinopolymorpha alba TaxID=533267 RepID=UPI0012F6A2F1|nr:hypothetical protein [Actinopolymorpha alba]
MLSRACQPARRRTTRRIRVRASPVGVRGEVAQYGVEAELTEAPSAVGELDGGTRRFGDRTTPCRVVTVPWAARHCRPRREGHPAIAFERGGGVEFAHALEQADADRGPQPGEGCVQGVRQVGGGETVGGDRGRAVQRPARVGQPPSSPAVPLPGPRSGRSPCTTTTSGSGSAPSST